MSNRSESNKPLPRKQRVINRGYLYSRKNENVKNLKIITKIIKKNWRNILKNIVENIEKII